MLFRRAILIGSALALSAGLAGCATRTTAPVQVTRFHLGQPIAPARISVEPADRAQSESLEFQAYATAVEAELGRLGFQVVPNVPNSELIAAVTVFRNARQGAPDGSGVSIGLGGGGVFGGGRRGGGGVGLGGGVSFPIGKRKPNEVVLTELSVQLKRRSEGTVVWEGRARTEQRLGGAAADSAQTVQRLASVLFAGFPGESGRTVMVK